MQRARARTVVQFMLSPVSIVIENMPIRAIIMENIAWHGTHTHRLRGVLACSRNRRHQSHFRLQMVAFGCGRLAAFTKIARALTDLPCDIRRANAPYLIARHGGAVSSASEGALLWFEPKRGITRTRHGTRIRVAHARKS